MTINVYYCTCLQNFDIKNWLWNYIISQSLAFFSLSASNFVHLSISVRLCLLSWEHDQLIVCCSRLHSGGGEVQVAVRDGPCGSGGRSSDVSVWSSENFRQGTELHQVRGSRSLLCAAGGFPPAETHGVLSHPGGARNYLTTNGNTEIIIYHRFICPVPSLLFFPGWDSGWTERPPRTELLLVTSL